MALVATSLTITPTSDGSKRMTAVGSVAVNERVAVTVVGVNDVTDPDNPVIPSGLVLILTSPCGRREYARFPADTGDAWAASGANATCTLNLATANLRAAFANACAQDTREGELRLESGTSDNLYGRATIVVSNWIQNPLDPVAGSTQIQTQIDNLTERIEGHQHNDVVEGESSFPHNNLTGRDDVGCHPAIESGVAGAIAAAAVAQGTANVAGANATTALETAQEALALKTIIQDEVELTQIGAVYMLPDIKALLNSIVTYLNTIRSAT